MTPPIFFHFQSPMLYLPETDSEDELPPEWEERVTPEGNVYFANNKSRLTQWIHPRTGKRKKVSSHLPYGWEKTTNEEGLTLYIDHHRGRTSFMDPRLAFASEVQEKNASFHQGFRQRFDASSSAIQVLVGSDLSGMVFVLTGGNSGIGYETARTFLRYGGSVVLPVRSVEHSQGAYGKLLASEKCSESRLRILECDLSSLKSTEDFVLKFKSMYDRCDVLVCNAGVFGVPHALSEDGYESTFQINFLSHIYLAYALRSSLIRAPSPKIVIVSSESHRFASLASMPPSSWDARSFSSPFSSDFFSMDAYNNSKFLLLVLGMEMDRRWASLGIRTLVVHPGNCVSSSLNRHSLLLRGLFALLRPFCKSLQQAAAPSVFAAASNEMKNVGGVYINNCFPCEPHSGALGGQAGLAAWQIAFQMIEDIVGQKKLFEL